MPIRPLADLFRITVNATAFGQAVVNVLHYVPETLNPNWTATINQVLTAFRTMWRASVLPGLTGDYAVTTYRIVELIGSTQHPTDPNKIKLTLGSEDSVAGDPVADHGGSNPPTLPTFVAATIQKRTGFAGRDKRATMRLATLPEAATDNAQGNRLTAAALTQLNIAATGLKGLINTGVAGDRVFPVILNLTAMRKLPQPQLDMIGGYTVITDMFGNVLVGSQRSRKERPSVGR